MPQKSFARKQFVLNLLGALAVIWAPHVLAVYDASTNTETLTDLMISRTRSDTAKGDMVDYIHPDRDLTITWTGPKRSDDFETPIKRPDGNAIRDGNVDVRNLTIDANFFEDYGYTVEVKKEKVDGQWVEKKYRNPYYLEIRNKGIYANDGVSHIKASGDINVTAKNDGIYTEAGGSVVIEGFKNLTVKGTGYFSLDPAIFMTDPPPPAYEIPGVITLEKTSEFEAGRYEGKEMIYTTGAHGIVDNGQGIDIRGGKVDIFAQGMQHSAVGNCLGYGGSDVTPESQKPFEFTGDHISIIADDVKLVSPGAGIAATSGNGGKKFTVTVNTGHLYSLGGWIGSISMGGNAEALINQDGTKGLIELLGSVSASAGGVVKINFDGAGSYVRSAADDSSGIAFSVDGKGRDNLTNPSETKIVANFFGENQTVHGSSAVCGELGQFDLTSTKDNFSIISVGDPHRENFAIESSEGATTNLVLQGNNASITGSIASSSKAKTTLLSTGDNLTINGNLKASTDRHGDLSTDVGGGSVYVKVSGANTTMTGSLEAHGKNNSLEAVFEKDVKLVGNIKATGTYAATSSSANPDLWQYFAATGNKLTATFNGVVDHEGQIESAGENTLAVKYLASGSHIHHEGSSYNSLVRNRGVMSLDFGDGITVSGNMENDQTEIKDGDLIKKKPAANYREWIQKGQLTVNFDGADWTGSITNYSGKAIFTMTGDATWHGNIVTGTSEADDLTEVTLKDKSAWRGHASGTKRAPALGHAILTDTARWDLDANSELELLKMGGSSSVSLVDTGEDKARLLQTAELQGSGTFILDMKYKDDNVLTYRQSAIDSTPSTNSTRNAGNEDGNAAPTTAFASDYLIAKAGSGEYTIVASEASDLSTLKGGNKLFFASVPTNSTTFKAGASRVVIPNRGSLFNTIYSYKVEKEADTTEDATFQGFENWYLTLDPENTGEEVNDNGRVPGPAWSAVMGLWRDNDTLVKRLGELHFIDRGEYASGSWARFTHQKTKRTSPTHAFSAPYDRIQVGYDWQKTDQAQNHWFLGAAYAYGWGDVDYAKGTGKMHSNEVTLYATHVRPTGHTWDIVARAGRISSEFTTSLGDKAKFKNWAASFGVEYGKTFALSERFTLEPQAQLTYHYLWGDDFRTRNGTAIHQDNADSLVGRLGVLASYAWGENARSGRLYAKASVLHDFKGEMSSTFTQGSTVEDRDDLSDTWYIVGLGTNVKMGKAWQAYFDVETGLAATVKTKYNINAGLRYTF